VNVTTASKRVIVTGALGGIGIPVVKKLNELGAHVVAVDQLAPQVAESLFRQYGISNATYFEINLNDSKLIQTFVTSISNNLPDALVALAGIVRSGELANQDPSEIKEVIETNLTSQAILAQTLLKTWIANGIQGNIIFVSSWVDSVPWPGITSYTSSKAGLVALCRGIARENARFGIRANLIAPGIVDVGMAAKQWREEPDYKRRASRAIPLGRLQQPDEVASGIAFLLSDAAKYMTGSRLLMDGGASLYPLDPEDVE
jgi:NAD(P)-dependent dehydrogenase (short-subunit alcohol dehydrogenase family)